VYENPSKQMQCTIFNLENEFSRKWYIFKKSTELGKIYDCIPWTELTPLLPPKKSPKGAPSWLPPQGYFGLMILKHYTGLSDEKLLERFNTDYAMQLFCGILLQENEAIRNNAFVSHVRSYLSVHLDMKECQKKLLSYWKTNGDVDNTHLLLMDSTCFESYIRYPTDVKLLWECIEKLYTRLLPYLCKQKGLKMPKTSYKDKKGKYLSYSKSRKRGHRKTLRMRKILVKFLEKGLILYHQLESKVEGFSLEIKLKNILTTLQTILEQQKQLLEQPGMAVENRIVSIHKPYLRPIVRGKENKPVEFGMKVHMCQVDGINWIEHHSFSSFNECNRLENSVLTHNEMLDPCTHLGADNIYPTNANRKFITEQSIKTNFPPKGPKQKDPKKAKADKKERNTIGKTRSTVLEGSFGNEKNNYQLRKIKALNEKTELVWVFFGVFTANAVAISKKRETKEELLKIEKRRKFHRKNAA
jgi:transposase, IS5 family